MERQFLIDELRLEESWRLFKILGEFVEGVDTLHDIGPAVSIFGSARIPPEDPVYQTAETIAARPRLAIQYSKAAILRYADGSLQEGLDHESYLHALSCGTEDKKEGVAAFLDFLAQPEMQILWHKETGYLPITSEAGDLTRSQGFYDANPGTDIAVIQMTAKEPTANSKGLRLGSFDQIRGIIDEELEAVWSGDKDAQAALDSAVERGNVLLRRFQQANQ